MKKTLILLVLATALLGMEFAPQASAQSVGYINGHEYVDLGLSVKWATCNIVASSPSDFGGYFAWGETWTKPIYTFENSITYRNGWLVIKADPRYDAARANWGGTWRLPSLLELEELFDKCKLKWITLGVHEGYRITGPNGNSIFLPAAGEYGVAPMYEDEVGCYWSCSLPPRDTENVHAGLICFDCEGWDDEVRTRCTGLSIRPVSN